MKTILETLISQSEIIAQQNKVIDKLALELLQHTQIDEELLGEMQSIADNIIKIED